MIAVALTFTDGRLKLPSKPDGTLDFDMAIPVMLGSYFPSGLLGLGSHGPDGVIHVRHGRERHRVQHRLDL